VVINSFSYLFLAVLLLTLGVQFWLAGRQIRHVQSERERVPEAFRAKIPLSTHRRAADYTVARTRFSRIDAVYSAILLLLWTFGGGLNLLDRAWGSLNLGALATGLGVLVSAVLLMSLLEVPMSAIRAFGIERRFGFNRTSVGVFIGDLIKGGALMVVLGVPLGWLVLWIMQVAGPLWWLYVWLVWFGFSLLMLWAYPAFIAPLFNKFEPVQDQELRQRVERLLQQCGFHSKGIFVMDGSRRSTHGNAYFGGIGSNKRIVFFDTLLKQLDDDEIEAVLAHELGHFRLHHIRKRLVLMGGISVLSLALLGWLIRQDWFYSGLGVDHHSTYMALLLFMMLAPVFGFLLTPSMSWLSRRHEFEADAYAACQRDGHTLVRALVKLYQENASTLTPDPLYSRFYDSHPPAPIRVNHLLAGTAGGSAA
jgi:STE24 endopeptidase